MKITELKRDGATANEPSEIVGKLIENSDYIEFLKEFEFDSVNETEEGFKYMARAVYFDEFCRTKVNRDRLPAVALIYKQMSGIVSSVAPEKVYQSTAEGLWSSYFEKKRMERNFNKFFSGKKDQSAYNNAVEKFKSWWKFSDDDIEALRYFVCQTIAGHSWPSKLQRAVYIWAEQQFTGKTTIAEMFVSCLNGETDTENVKDYMSDIPKEWQFDRFAIPSSLNKRAILLDEAFSGKNGTENYYPRIKTELTSTNCRWEVKNGGFYSSKCYRNYIFTSNYPPEKMIQDKRERRFFVINMRHMPPILSTEELFSTIADFCKNAEPEKDIAIWYRQTMPNVIGNVGVRELEIANAFVTHDFLKMLTAARDGIPAKRKIYFPSEFKKYIFNEAGIPKTDRNAELIIPATIQVFGEPLVLKGGQRYYNLNKLIEKVTKIIEDHYGDDDDEKIIEENLPF